MRSVGLEELRLFGREYSAHRMEGRRPPIHSKSLDSELYRRPTPTLIFESEYSNIEVGD